MSTDHASDIQRRMYMFILDYMSREGMPPTNREIGREMQIASTGHVDYHLTMLEKKGLISRQAKKSRGIKLTKPLTGIPVYGSIAAGQPLQISIDPEQYLDIDHEMEHDNTYVLIVKGNSMIEDHICNGDFVIIKPQFTYNNGDIVVAVHLQKGNSGSATLKRLFQEHDRIRLQPANSELESIFVPRNEWDQEWNVQGKVVGIFRHLSAFEEGRSEQDRNIESINLKLYAIARIFLEDDDKAFVGKMYSIHVGVSQSKPENFWGESFDLSMRSIDKHIAFDILLHASENIKLITEWHLSLLYDPHNLEPQLVEFTFQVEAVGQSYLVLDFYCERRWLNTTRLEFDAVDQSQLSIVSSEV